MKNTGIYKIQSISKPERVYIGSAIEVNGRIRRHLNDLLKKRHHSDKLQRHYNKYGKNDLQFMVILECPKDQLIAREQDFIDALNPYFNNCKVAGSSLGYRHSKDSIEKMKIPKPSLLGNDYAKGNIPWNKGGKIGFIPIGAFKKGQTSLNKGKTASDDTRKQQSISAKKGWIKRKLKNIVI